MASKSLQEQKRELLKSLEDKRNRITDGAQRLQGSVQEIPSQAKSSLTGGLLGGSGEGGKIPFNNPFSPRNVTPLKEGRARGAVGLLQSAPAFIGRVSRLNKPFRILGASGGSSFRLPSAEGERLTLSKRPVMLGLGALLLVGFLSGSGSRRKKKRKYRAEKKEQKLAKFGLGFFLFKWLLGASQPAVRHLITKQVKKRLLR